MLHRIAGSLLLTIFLFVFVSGVPAWAQNDELRGVTTADEKATLESLLKERTVDIVRRVPPPKGFTVPGAGLVLGKGWIAAEGRVVTSEALIAGWPERMGDSIEVIAASGKRFRAAVGIQEALLGLAVLDVPGLAASSAARPPTTNLADGVMRGGRHLFGIGDSGRMERFVVGQKGGGAWAYFFKSIGSGSPGTPLVDGLGRLVTVVVRRGGHPVMVPLLAPPKAMRALYEREAEWTP